MNSLLAALVVGIVFQNQAFANGKINCNGTIFTKNSSVDRALNRLRLEQATSAESATYFMGTNLEMTDFIDGVVHKYHAIANMYVMDEKNELKIFKVTENTLRDITFQFADGPLMDKTIDELLFSVCQIDFLDEIL